jgi:hypothetical protein
MKETRMAARQHIAVPAHGDHPPMSDADRRAHDLASYIRRPASDSDEFLRRSRAADAKAKAAGTLRPVPSGIVRPLLTMGVA